MAKSVLYMSMSLDGFITGPDDGPGNGLGTGGGRLHEWLGEPVADYPHFDPPGLSGQVFAELIATGTVVVGQGRVGARRRPCAVAATRGPARRAGDPPNPRRTDAVPLAQQAAQELAASDQAWREVSLSVADGTRLTPDGAARVDRRAAGEPTDSHHACDHEAVSVGRHQKLRVLEGRFIIEQATDARGGVSEAGVLALVFGPDGRTRVRRDDTAEDAWSALWNGDDAHDPQATGMLSAIVAPLAAGELPVWVASSFDGDLILVPAGRLDEAIDVLRQASHQVAE